MPSLSTRQIKPNVGAATSKRERSKEERRQRICDAAKQLLIDFGADGLTMREVARIAGVSEATPHNLFGSKAGIIKSLFEQSLESLVSRSKTNIPSSPLERLLSSTQILADFCIANKQWWRELLRAARESGAGNNDVLERPIGMLENGIKELKAVGYIDDTVSLPTLAMHVHLANVGAFELWTCGSINDQVLRKSLKNNLLISLLPVAEINTRSKLLDEIDKISRTRDAAILKRKRRHLSHSRRNS